MHPLELGFHLRLHLIASYEVFIEDPPLLLEEVPHICQILTLCTIGAVAGVGGIYIESWSILYDLDAPEFHFTTIQELMCNRKAGGL